MSRRRLELALWALAALVILWGRARWHDAVPRPPLAPLPVIAAVGAPPAADLAGRLRQADSTVAGNPFRLDRSPAPSTIGDLPAVDPGLPPPPPPFRPQLSVSGMVGPPWAAILEGVPGRDGGVVVRGGERLGELRVRSVSPAAVVVSGPDTTWRLTVRRTWQ